MIPRPFPRLILGASWFLFATWLACAQPPDGFPPFGPKGPGGGMFGGPPGMKTRKILEKYDANGDGWLNQEERKAARAELKGDRGGFGPRGGPKGRMGRGSQDPPKPGPSVRPADVPSYADRPLYDPHVLRTVFLQFENADWENELQDFHGTDVDVPATLVVDGKTYRDVGVHFRGMSSYMMVPAGYKRSLNLALDLVHGDQRIGRYKTLNLLNGHEDASLLSTFLFSHIARQYIPAPKANMVRVVINGECWGVYTNVQQFDKVFLEENFKTTKGTRWKVPGSPGGGGGLDDRGEDPASYRRLYEIKSKDDPQAWKALIEFCKILNETPPDKLEAALAPKLDIEGALRFLALDIALINNDGYWIRGSDYSIYLDPAGKFHILPHDMNEAFRPGGGPGFGPPGGFGGPPGRMARPGDILPNFLQDELNLSPEQRKQLEALQKEVNGRLDAVLTPEQRQQFRGPLGPGGPGGPGGGPGGRMGGGVELDPLQGLTDSRKPLRSKLLQVPRLRERYLQIVREIAEKSLDWQTLGPVVAEQRRLIESEVRRETRNLESVEAFLRLTADAVDGEPGRGREMPLRQFADQRRAYLLKITP